MRRELGIAQHHDAVTGTARNNVSDDYIYRLDKGIKSVSESVKQIIAEENFIKEKNPENLEVCLDAVTEKRCIERRSKNSKKAEYNPTNQRSKNNIKETQRNY